MTGCTPVVEDKYADEDRFTDSGYVPGSFKHTSDTTAAYISKDFANTKFFNQGSYIETRNVSPLSVVAFSQTLIGIPYKYASSDPKIGFDCSGFINYVFNHFDIAVPRSSFDFTNAGEDVKRADVLPGDLVLFTGTDPTEKKVGHLGIVSYNSQNTLLFIHSTSGKQNGVTETLLNDYYQERFVKFVRVFKQNNQTNRKG